jgi:shikimate kinase
MVIILIGYMGSGKSTIGKNLSNILKFNYVDLDAYIQDKEGQSISELFSSKGEIYFRKIEGHYLEDVLAKCNTVLALGGGTPCYGNNMQTIKMANNSKSIYLKTSIPELVNRLSKEKSKRPLISHLQTTEDLTEFVGKHLFERSVFYHQADVTIVVDHKSINEIVEQIVMELF